MYTIDMITLFIGPLTKEKKEKQDTWMSRAKDKFSQSAFHTYSDSDNISWGDLRMHAGSVDMFGGRAFIYVKGGLTSLLTDKQSLEHIQYLHESETIYLFSDEKLLAKDKKIFEKEKIEILEFKDSKAIINNKKNVFEINKHFLSRDKRVLWLTYRDFIDSGVGADALIPPLSWQCLMMIHIFQDSDYAHKSMKPYSFSQSQKGTKKYTIEEVQSVLKKLITISHLSRVESKYNLEHELEQVILSL
ncbi:MAG: hypothetical protein ACI9AR_000212 [Flavobacteriaceae bacterium]|jgi:hypothetical protein